MITSISKFRSLARPLDISEDTRSRLFLAALIFVVVSSFVVSLLAPLIFSVAFSGVHLSPSDLGSYMIGW